MDLSNILDSFQVLQENLHVKRLIILAVYLDIMKVVDLLIDKVLKRMAGLTRFTLDDHLVKFAHRPLCWTVFWVGAIHSVIVAPLPPPWQTTVPSMAKTILLFIWHPYGDTPSPWPHTEYPTSGYRGDIQCRKLRHPE